MLRALGALTALDLSHNRLTGPLDGPALAAATGGAGGGLRRLRLQHNALSGALPLELGALSSLEELSLHANRFSGAIPPELGACARLRVLALEVRGVCAATRACEAIAPGARSRPVRARGWRASALTRSRASALASFGPRAWRAPLSSSEARRMTRCFRDAFVVVASSSS